MIKLIITPEKEEGVLHLHLQRNYHKKGTNGNLYINGAFFCHTIELPWKENAKQVSCIPEGVYNISKRFSKKYGSHMLIENVPDRDLVLIHPANNALKELMGCIAPVSILDAPGCGSFSRKVFEPLRRRIYEALEMGDQVKLTIFSDRNVIKQARQLITKKQAA